MKKIDCEHDEGYVEDFVPKMITTNTDGVYAIPYTCYSCKKKVYEIYNYEGVEEEIE